MRLFTPFLALALAAAPAGALTTRDRVVPLSADWTSNGLALQWPTGGQAQAWIVQKKPLLQADWTTLATLTNPAAIAFTDVTAVAGAAFEYKVTRQDAITNAWGFLYGGVQVPPVDSRGALLLVVESNAAAALAPELARFEHDLAGDGWRPVRLTAGRREWNEPGWAAAVTNLKARILAAAADHPDAQAVLLFGRLPVPYSGNFAPDGHPERVGAWPADAYYGDLDTAPWTDSLSNAAAIEERLRNRPGDGKFDPSVHTDFAAELMVGRIDLAHMPAFAQPEIELLRQYLGKNHQYRQGRLNVPARGLVRDTFGFFFGEAFAQTGYRDFGTWFSPAQVYEGGLFPALRGNSYMAVYGCGSGVYTNAAGVCSTYDFATGPVHTVFTFLLGSRFGDWDNTNNLLRAPLGSYPWPLACAWSGRPKWYGHPLDMGEPLGRLVQMLQGAGYEDYEDEERSSGVHATLMGDPTLRLRTPPPPRHLQAVLTNGYAALSWQAPPGSNWLYRVARAPAGGFAFTNLHPGFVDALSFTGSLGGLTSAVFRVRAARLESVRSGSFTNLGQGAFARVDAAGQANRPPSATNRFAATVAGRPVTVPLGGTDPDGDPVFAALTAWPATGTLTGAPSALVYLPPAGFTGSVQFAYEVSDGLADSSNALVTVTVAPTQTLRGTSCDWLIRTVGYSADYEQEEELDHDGDGLPTWAEYRAGTDPLSAASAFALLAITPMPGSNRLAWYATTNSGVTSSMTVLRGITLPPAGWAGVASNLPRHPSGTNVWDDPSPPPRAFYRVLIP